MSGNDEKVLATKLDILIEDFREFKADQKETNRELRQHAIAEDKVQARIENTTRWHSILGAFAVSCIIGFGTYMNVELSQAKSDVNALKHESVVYKTNQETLIELLEIKRRGE